MRVFAVQIDDDLFDAITDRVKALGITKRGYIEALTLKELRESQEAKQTENQIMRIKKIKISRRRGMQRKSVRR